MYILYIKPEVWKETLDLQIKFKFSDSVLFAPRFDTLSVLQL